MALSSTDLQTVYSLLRNALSQDEGLRKPAENTLSACENRPGFCSCLLEIIASHDAEEQNGARWLASVYFKNSINRYWRTRRDSPGITDAEKPYLRSKLLELIREENNQVAVQLAVLISKIARIDYPREWQDLFPSLVQKLQSPDMLTTQRVYMVLHQTLKELSTKRLAVDQQNFSQLTSHLFDFTWHHWCNDTQTIIHEFAALISNTDGNLLSSPQGRALILMCDRWLLCLKILRRMILFGFPSDEKSVREVPPVKQVCPAFLQSVQSFLQFRSVLQSNHPFHDFIDKACLALMKALVAIQKEHPYSFSNKNVLPPALEFVCTQITEQKWDSRLFEHFLIQCMVLLQRVVQCVAYRVIRTGKVVDHLDPTMEEAKGKLAKEAEDIVGTVLDNEKLLLICETLVKRYFVYTSKDLEDWSNDPEAFYHEQALVLWREKIRPCAEAVYNALFEHHRGILAPQLVQILKQTSHDCPPPSPEAEVPLSPLLSKEAVYYAVGLATYDLYDYINFKSWYDGALCLELNNTHPNNRILRRRIAWLLGQWVSKIDLEMRRSIYVVLLRLLGDGDLAVQLAACHSLQLLIDDVHFYEEEFVEFVPACLELLFQFMENAQDFDSKLQIFSLISLVIDRLGDKVAPCREKLLDFIRQVWQTSESESLLKIQVVLALQRLVNALAAQSPSCYELLLPILHHVSDVNQPDELNMLEDGLLLWKTTLKCAPAMIPQLLALFPHAVSAMERSLDNLQVCMQILESYILLGGAEFIHHHAAGVLKIFKLVVGKVNEKGMMCTLSVIDTLIQCFPGDAPPLLEEVLQTLFIVVVNGQGESDLVRASAGAILARVLVQNSTFFASLTSQPSLVHALRNSGVHQSPLLLFFDSWLDKVDSLTTMSKRKVCALALCVLLTSRESQILDRLEQILSICTSILHETEEELNGVGNSSSGSSYDYWTHAGDSENEDSRKRQITSSDPVNSVALAPLLKEKLQTCAALHGEAAFNVALSKLHPSLLSELQQL